MIRKKGILADAKETGLSGNALKDDLKASREAVHAK